jgi:hypothetical protein
MFGAPERLTAFGARTVLVITTIMDQKVQSFKPLNLGEGELYTT